MQLLLTTVLPFLAHDHASAVAFLTCRHHNFHASIIPEFLSDEKRVKSFCGARKRNEMEADFGKQYTTLYNLFVQTPLMQFSPSLVLHGKDSVETILKPLLATKYFTRTLQRCSVDDDLPLTTDLFQGLSKVQTLVELDLGESEVENEHLEIIVNSFPSLEALTIDSAGSIKVVDVTAKKVSSPPLATKTLRSLTIRNVDASFATQFVPHFTNLRKLVITGPEWSSDQLDIAPLSASLHLLIELSLAYFSLDNIEFVEDLVHLSSLHFYLCDSIELSFLTQENSLPDLTTLCVWYCGELPTSSVTLLSHASNLRALEIAHSEFDNDCLQYLEDMVHLRKLELSQSKITGDSRSLKTLMQNLIQLEELNLSLCKIGNQGAIAGALYSTHSRLRVLNLRECNLVDDDLNGIVALKNTLEVLELGVNENLTTEGLRHCRNLDKLKILRLNCCHNISDLSPFKDCLKLEELDITGCHGLTDDSFKVFSEDPNSFPNLRVLRMSDCTKLTEEVFEHLAKNNDLVYRLKELNVGGMRKILLSSAAARNRICQFRGLRKLSLFSGFESEYELQLELMRGSKNLEEI